MTKIGIALEMLLEKGKQFDQGGTETPLVELLEIKGLFPLKAIKGRLPIPERRLKKMIYGGGAYASCFHNPFKDEGSRGVIYVDLQELNGLIRKRM